jgi:hypothetical protein
LVLLWQQRFNSITSNENTITKAIFKLKFYIMSFENYPKAEEASIVTKEEKRGLNKLLLSGLAVALLGTWGYIIYDKNKTKEQIEQKQTLVATTVSQKEQLQRELEDAAMRYDELKTSNAKMDSSISAKDADIAEKKARIKSLLTKANATEQDLAEAKRLIISLNNDIDGYKQQIVVLQEQKTKLVQEKAVVTEQRDRARRDYDSSTLVIKEKENMIDVGSTIHASNFNIVGINEKRRGKEKETSTAKKIDKLRISFDLNQNMITKSGEKDVYVCITSPDGQPVAVQALGSGTFTERSGTNKVYTQKLVVNYNQAQRQTVSFDWKQNSDFQRGDYKIEVYNNGFKVGESVKTLKKGGLFG